MKEIKSPVEKFPGTVKLSDPLTFPQYIAWEEAGQAVDKAEQAGKKGMAWVSGICACVEEWHLEGLPDNVTPETFPSTPIGQSIELINWLIEEIRAVIAGEETNPNA